MSSYANYVSIKPSDATCAPNKKVREQVSLAATLLTLLGIKLVCH